MSVSGRPLRRATVALPSSREPPEIEILAALRVRATRWKSGSNGGSGKSWPTVIRCGGPPFTVMTAEVGSGAGTRGGGGEAVDPDEPDGRGATEPASREPEPPPESAEPPRSFGSTCCVKGSLLSKRLKEPSWPRLTDGPVADASSLLTVGVVVVAGAVVVVAVVVVEDMEVVVVVGVAVAGVCVP